MHTLKFDDAKAWVNHNGDWSGDAEITWNEGDNEVTIPCAVLLKLADAVVLQRARERLQDAADKA